MSKQTKQKFNSAAMSDAAHRINQMILNRKDCKEIAEEKPILHNLSFDVPQTMSCRNYDFNHLYLKDRLTAAYTFSQNLRDVLLNIVFRELKINYIPSIHSRFLHCLIDTFKKTESFYFMEQSTQYFLMTFYPIDEVKITNSETIYLQFNAKYMLNPKVYANKSFAEINQEIQSTINEHSE